MSGPCPNMENTRQFTCLDPDDPSGGNLCGIGCNGCNDEPGQLVTGGMSNNLGKRWLRPSPDFPSRDAYGRFGPLKSGEPRLVPVRIVYESAPCYDQAGGECFDADVCDCYPPPDPGPVGETDRCSNGEKLGWRLRGVFPDCAFQKGTGWTDDNLHCRTVDEHFPHPISLTQGPIHQAMFARSNCLDNVFVPCMARIASSNCPTGAGRQPNAPEYYFNDACRQALFNYLFIAPGINAMPKIVSSAHFPLADAVLVDVRNKALAKVFGTDGQTRFPNGGIGVKFNRVDNLHFPGGAGSENVKLNQWGRTWDGPALVRSGAGVDPVQFPTILDMPNCYLKFSRCRVHAQLKITRVSVDIHLIANRTCIFSFGVNFNQVIQTGDVEMKPYARVRIRVTCGVFATMPDGPCVLQRPWMAEGGDVPLEVINPFDGDGFPLVRVVGSGQLSGKDRDPLIYVHPDLGTTFVPPNNADWHGWLGAFSDPPTRDIWDGASCADNSGIRVFCQKVTQQFQTSFSGVPAMPALLGSNPDSPNQLYGGSMRMSFPSRCN